MCKLPSLISGGGEVTAPEYHFICPIVFTSHSLTWLCSPLTTLSPLAAARPGEMWGFEGEWEVRGEREEEQAQTKTQIWSVEDYILLAWALLMEAQISSNLGRVDTPEKIVSGNFDISIVPPLLQKVAGAGWTWEKVSYFKNCLHDFERAEWARGAMLWSFLMSVSYCYYRSKFTDLTRADPSRPPRLRENKPRVARTGAADEEEV